MNRASIRFYAALNDFLPPYRQQVTFDHYFQESASVKDMIEALGVPHPEVDLILANAQSVDFAYGFRTAIASAFIRVLPLLILRLFL